MSSDPSAHARSALVLTFGTMGVAALIAVGITVVGLSMRGPLHPEASAPSSSSVPPAEGAHGAVPNASGEPTAPADTPQPAPVRVAVLAFQDLSAEGQREELAYLSDGLAEVVATDFESVNGIALVDVSALDLEVASSESAPGEAVSETTREALAKLAKAPANAEVAVLGSYLRADGKLRAEARFVGVESGTVLAAIRVEHPANDVFEVQNELAKKVRDAVREVRGQLRPRP